MPTMEQAGYLVPAEAMTATMLVNFGRIYPPSDDALWEDRELQRRMRQDPDINNPLEKRVRVVSALEYEIEPENPEDPVQQAEANAIMRSIDRIPRLRQMLKNLARGVWYSDAACQLVYDVPDQPIIGVSEDEGTTVELKLGIPIKQQPIHSDSVYFQWNGEMAVLQRPHRSPAGYKENRPPAAAGMIAGPMGYYLPIDEVDRRRIIHVAYNVEAPDYFKARDLGQIFKGRGLRDLLWYSWWFKQSVYSGAGRYLERLAHGRLVGMYPSGNAKAKNEMEIALKNYENDNIILIPIDGDANDVRKHIDVVEADGSGYHLFVDMLDRLQEAMQKAIVGSSLTMDAEATGMGSGVADRHYQTFHEIVTEDAGTLSEAITHDLVRVIQEINFPESTWRHKFKLLVPEDDEKFMDMVERFVGLGGEVPDDAVRQRIGVPKPEAGEAILTNPETMDFDFSMDSILDVPRSSVSRNGSSNGTGH